MPIWRLCLSGYCPAEERNGGPKYLLVAFSAPQHRSRTWQLHDSSRLPGWQYSIQPSSPGRPGPIDALLTMVPPPALATARVLVTVAPA